MKLASLDRYKWASTTRYWDALRGGKEELFDFIVEYLHAGDPEALANDAMAPPRKRLCPEPLVKLAVLLAPFDSMFVIVVCLGLPLLVCLLS
ncbi:hypothetical protein HanIR_Chr00c25g0910801 [Helianthus annuus]|nr:hypothetical protein HanIR_Chr00c25g0910801 [Helianthus annuus]